MDGALGTSPLVRITDPLDGPLIVRALAEGGEERLARALRDHERRLLERLRGLDGCPPLVVRDPAAPEVAVADPGGVWLAESGLAGRLDLPRFLAIAGSLARLLAAVHARGVFHRAIDPSRILIRPADAAVWLVDFSQAASFAEEPPANASPGRPGDDPTYRSPEQLGHTNRPVDYRTDLYSLGLVLYTLATGAPPFADPDPFALSHAHLTRDPPTPRTRAPWLPEALARLILILLAKEPEERYQSAAGLAYDLGQAGHENIRLRERDVPLTPRPPRRLHGRDRELAALTDALLAVGRGQRRAVFVSGPVGVGKTALIEALRRTMAVTDGGLFASGKCEQFQTDRPLLAPARALAGLCQVLLAAPAAVVAQRRSRLLSGLGPELAALYEVVPELAALLGRLPPAPPAGPLETRHRLNTLLVTLIRRIAGLERSLVLFLDDLQWADRATLELLKTLLTEPDLPGLLLIGAYRDQEVAADHPLTDLVRGAAPPLTLSGLDAGTLADLLGEVFHMPPSEVQPLAARLHPKTAGNPLFTLQLVQALHRAGVLRVAHEQGRWVWEDAALNDWPVSANLVDLLAAGLGELPSETRAALAVCACLGQSFSLGRLACASGGEPTAVATALVPALERGILTTADALALSAGAPGVGLRFCHDRMRQTVYQLRNEAGRARLHRSIARRLAAADAREALPGTAEHYAAAVALLRDPAERALARRLFTEAALRARRSGACATAERFLRLALDLLPPDPWRAEPSTARALHAGLHLSLFSQYRHAEADAVFDLLSAQAASPLNLIEPTCLQIASLASRTRYGAALELGLRLLERLGLPVPLADLDRSRDEVLAACPDVFALHRIADLDPNRDQAPVIRPDSALAQELDALYAQLAAGALERLPESPPLTDPRRLGAIRIMNGLIPVANFTHPILVCWLPLRVARLWLEEGYCESAIYPWVALGPVVMGLRRDFATAERLARAALEIGAVREGGRETARGWHIFTNYIGHWLHPLEADIDQARRARDALQRAGDRTFASFATFALVAAQLDTGERLAAVAEEIEQALGLAHTSGDRHSEQIVLTYRLLVRALQGDSDAPLPAPSGEPAADDAAGLLEAARDNPTARCYFHIQRALLAALFDDPPALAHHAERATALSLYIHGKYPTALANVLHSLALTDQLRTTPETERAPLRARLALNQDWLAARAADAPVNFGHLHDLIEAERLDAQGEHWAALAASERALRRSAAHRRPWHHAFITERAGLLHLRHGLEYAGRALLTRACRLWIDWGADAKAGALRQAWPFVTAAWPAGSDPNRVGLARAAATLAQAASPDGLVTRVMELVAQLTGATDLAFLALDEAGDWQLEGGLLGTRPLGRMTLAQAEARGLVPTSVLNLGSATLQPVVSEDAVADARFAADPHFDGLRLCSLLGLPILVQGRVGAFLILEHRRLRAAFATERVLDLLGGAAADLPLLHNLRLVSLGSLVALHSVRDLRHREALEQAHEEARRERTARERQDRFIDLLTHEYRTPLAILQTNLDILSLTSDPTRWRDALRHMGQAVERLGEIFDGSPRSERREPLRLQTIDLATWLAQRIDEAQTAWPAPAPPVVLRAPGPAPVAADPALLKTVLLNLLDNARKYGPTAGPIRLEVQTTDERVLLNIGNDCLAAPECTAADLLTRGRRGANGRGVPGLGLGLYLVERLVSEQGGRVELALGQPERFEVRLSFARAPAGDSP